MQINPRFQVALLGASIVILTAVLTACNPVPLSVVASDFSINGVKGTASSTTSTSTTTALSTTAASTSTTSSNSASTSSTATTVQNITIDLTGTEACTDFTNLVASVQLDEGVTISPAPGVARDYTSPVTFTVTESYGAKVTYIVTVKGKACATTS